MSILNRFWTDDAGVIISAELILVITILVIGLIVGLSAVRTSIVQELGDIAEAFGVLNQSYSFGGVTHCCALTRGTEFGDAQDDCDPSGHTQSQNGNVVSVCLAAQCET